MEMVATRLVQRLKAPNYRIVDGVKKDIHAFGGGDKNGGLTEEHMSVLREIFSFDYMGAAEFEYGNVASAVCKLVDDGLKGLLIKGKIKKGSDRIFYICPEWMKVEVVKRIKKLRDGKYKNIDLKAHCGLKEHFESKYPFDKVIVGWLELDNGFMFFTDEAMRDKMFAAYTERTNKP